MGVLTMVPAGESALTIPSRQSKILVNRPRGSVGDEIEFTRLAWPRGGKDE
jgi:hypothetical protein